MDLQEWSRQIRAVALNCCQPYIASPRLIPMPFPGISDIYSPSPVVDKRRSDPFPIQRGSRVTNSRRLSNADTVDHTSSTRKSTGTRRRVPVACDRCRTLKQRCDSEVPRCMPCLRANAVCNRNDMPYIVEATKTYIESLEKHCLGLETRLAEALQNISVVRSH